MTVFSGGVLSRLELEPGTIGQQTYGPGFKPQLMPMQNRNTKNRDSIAMLNEDVEEKSRLDNVRIVIYAKFRSSRN